MQEKHSSETENKGIVSAQNEKQNIIEISNCKTEVKTCGSDKVEVCVGEESDACVVQCEERTVNSEDEDTTQSSPPQVELTDKN